MPKIQQDVIVKHCAYHAVYIEVRGTLFEVAAACASRGLGFYPLTQKECDDLRIDHAHVFWFRSKGLVSGCAHDIVQPWFSEFHYAAGNLLYHKPILVPAEMNIPEPILFTKE